MITSPDNEKLKLIRKLQSRREREREGLFAAEGEDLVAAATDAGVEPRFVLVAGEDVEPDLLARVSALGSGSRVIGVYERRFSELPPQGLSVYLEGLGDPGNVGTIIRSAAALADGPVVLGPGCADPFSPKGVRASMGSIFTRPPARGGIGDLGGAFVIALDATADSTLDAVPLPQTDVSSPTGAEEAPESSPAVVVALGAEREGLSPEVAERADALARIPIRAGGPESLNVAAAAAIALHVLGNRMARPDA